VEILVLIEIEEETYDSIAALVKEQNQKKALKRFTIKEKRKNAWEIFLFL
jgi:hypothetical protein